MSACELTALQAKSVCHYSCMYVYMSACLYVSARRCAHVFISVCMYVGWVYYIGFRVCRV